MSTKGKNPQSDTNTSVNQPNTQTNRNPSANPGSNYSQPQKKTPGGK